MSDQDNTELYDQISSDEVELETIKGKAVGTFTLTNPTWVVKFERMALLDDELILRHGERMCKVQTDVFEEDALHKIANFKELHVQDRGVMKNTSTETEKGQYKYRTECLFCDWEGEWKIGSKETAAANAIRDGDRHEREASGEDHHARLKGGER